MANNLSDYAEDKLLDHVLGTASFTAPSAVYLALWVGDPGEDGAGGAEVTGGSYARQAVTFTASSGGATSNDSLITFPTAAASWGTVDYAAIFDASTSGNMLWHGALTAAKTIGTGDVIRFQIGDIDLSLA